MSEWKQPHYSQSFDEYKKQARTFERFLWRDFEGQSLEDELKRRFDSYRNYHELFEGCCLKGGTVDVVLTQHPNVIILSKDWKGSFSDGSDLELHLFGSSRFPLFPTVRHTVTLYSSGTGFVPYGGMEHRLGGETLGYHKVWHKRGPYDLTVDNWDKPSYLLLQCDVRLAKFEFAESA